MTHVFDQLIVGKFVSFNWRNITWWDNVADNNPINIFWITKPEHLKLLFFFQIQIFALLDRFAKKCVQLEEME